MRIPIHGDSELEADETFSVQLANVNQGNPAGDASFSLPAAQTVTIEDDDALTVMVRSRFG